MASRSSMAFLQRQRVFLPNTLHTPKYEKYGSRSHYRPIVFAPQLLKADTPRQRVQTQRERERVPYQPVITADGTCTDSCNR